MSADLTTQYDAMVTFRPDEPYQQDALHCKGRVDKMIVDDSETFVLSLSPL